MAVEWIPVVDAKTHAVVGWVIHEVVQDWQKIRDWQKVGDVYVPAEYHLRLPGSAEPSGEEQPSLLITFQVRDGAPVCTAVSIESTHGGRQVLAGDFKTLGRKLNKWREVAFKLVMNHGQGGEKALTIGPVDRAVARKADNAAQKRARTKVTDKLLKEVANLYRDNVNDAPCRTIRERYNVSQSTAGRYVLLARKAGYLPPTKPEKKKA